MEGVLIEKIQGGNPVAFTEIIEKYQKKAYYFCLHMINHAQEAEDLAQEAFVRVFKSIKNFRGHSSFQTWFYQILLNLCRTHLRRRYMLNRVTFNFPQNTEFDERGQMSIETIIPDKSWGSDPGKVMRNQELKTALAQSLDQLPPQQKEIFTLKHFLGLKISEIAEITGNAEGTIKTHLFRAIKAMQVKLKDFREEF